VARYLANIHSRNPHRPRGSVEGAFWSGADRNSAGGRNQVLVHPYAILSTAGLSRHAKFRNGQDCSVSLGKVDPGT
jgi:hypothetical protein